MSRRGSQNVAEIGLRSGSFGSTQTVPSVNPVPAEQHAFVIFGNFCLDQS